MPALKHSVPFCLMWAIAVPLLVLTGCQTPAQPRPWQDEFTGEQGQYIYASRQSGGYDLRFAVSDADPGYILMRVQSSRPAIHGNRAYFLIDGEREAMPMYVHTQTRAGRARSSHVGVGVGRGMDTRFHTGVGMSFPRSTVEHVHFATVRLSADFVQRLLDAAEVRFRAGEQPGPTFTLSETTRQRLAELVAQYAAAPTAP